MQENLSANVKKGIWSELEAYLFCAGTEFATHFACNALAARRRAGCGRTLDAPTITVVDDMSACFNSGHAEAVYTKVGDEFVFGSKRFDIKEIERLIQVIKDSEREQSLDMQKLGMTDESVARHREDIIETEFKCSEQIWESDSNVPLFQPSPREVLEKHQDLINVRSVSDVARRHIDFLGSSTTRARITATFDDGKGVIIQVSSVRMMPWMLPWTVKIGDKVWDTYSLEVPKVVAKLADPSGPEFALLDGSDYWTDKFWHDQIMWDKFIDIELMEAQDKRALQRLPGYLEASREFEMVSADGSLFKHGYAVTIRPRTSKLIDLLTWRGGPGSTNNPNGDWRQIAEEYSKCSEAARKQSWLSEWKAEDSDRKLEAKVLDLGEVPGVGFDQVVWRREKMSGKPDIIIDLKRGGLSLRDCLSF